MGFSFWDLLAKWEYCGLLGVPNWDISNIDGLHKLAFLGIDFSHQNFLF